jgi:hypothetical protein
MGFYNSLDPNYTPKYSYICLNQSTTQLWLVGKNVNFSK